MRDHDRHSQGERYNVQQRQALRTGRRELTLTQAQAGFCVRLERHGPCYSALNKGTRSPSETARAGAYAAPRATASETRAADVNVSGSRGLMS